MEANTEEPAGVEGNLRKVPDDPRITKVGAKLRMTSIDELPQLWNVIKGEMSLVGPRPLPLPEDVLISERHSLRRGVRPGLTGLWQVQGRSNIPFEAMVRLDYSYVLNWSLLLDIKILLRTLSSVMQGRGAY